MPDCPKCLVEIEFEEVLNEEIDFAGVVFHNRGCCPECKKTYNWKDKYVFVESFDFEEE